MYLFFSPACSLHTRYFFINSASLEDSWMDWSRANSCLIGLVTVGTNQNGCRFVILTVCGDEIVQRACWSLSVKPDVYWRVLALFYLCIRLCRESRDLDLCLGTWGLLPGHVLRGKISWNSGCPPISTILRWTSSFRLSRSSDSMPPDLTSVVRQRSIILCGNLGQNGGERSLEKFG